jgi:hypothetical protein
MAITDIDTNINLQKIEIFQGIDTDNFHFDNQNNLKVLYLNARSIRSGGKLAHIESFLNDINCRIHIIVIYK